MYDSYIRFDREVAHHFLHERRGRTVSQVVGDGLDRNLDLPRGLGKVLFHGALVVGAAATGAAIFKSLTR